VTAFKTKAGRIVYDGAGVMPDLKTEEQKFENILIALVSKYHIFNYATQYVLGHPEAPALKDFSLTEAEYQKFIAYLSDKDYSYKTRTELQLAELKKDSEEEKYFDAIRTEYDALVNRIQLNKKDDLVKHKAAIKKYLEEEIVGRYYFQKGRIEYSLQSDADLQPALSLLNEPAKYKGILTKVAEPTKPFNPSKKF